MGLHRVCLFALLALASATKSAKDLPDDADKYLLPWNIRPEHYDITLFTNIENFKIGDESSFQYSGISEITALVLYGDVDEIVLHTYDTISIVSAQVVSLDVGGPLNYSVTVGRYDNETNKQTFGVSPALSNNGRYRITIYYNGQNSDTLKGFYRSSFQDENNNTRWLLTTHFESFGAREAFPCFDEPEYKATYKLAIHYNQTLAQDGYRAFFNSEIESEAIVNGVRVTTFQKTIRPLSSYLVAFILAPFVESSEPSYFNSSFNGEESLKPLWTIGQPKYFAPRRTDRLSQVAGPAALNQMTKFTGVGFGMSKVHQAGIPDFGPGAMENWGLVTYRETAVFWDNETGTTSQKRGVVSTSTHELAHQWFGDLVTLHWWSDVWLNEGFATYFATHASNEFREPELDTSDWNLIGTFVSGTLHGALKTDSNPASRPMTAPAYEPNTIDRYFDGISYDKAGSVLRMWSHILSPETFYSSLNRYLRQQEESVGTPEILLASFDGTVDELPSAERPNLGLLTVAELFEGWHLQAGYPVLNVSRDGANITVSQRRFLSEAGDDSPRWNVPISYSTNLEQNFNDTSAKIFLYATDKSASFSLGNANADWIVLNNQQTGFYRVNYDSANWEKLIAIANDESQYDLIHEFNRAQILDDAAALGASTQDSYLSPITILRLLPIIKHDRSLPVWETALRVMKEILHNLQGRKELEATRINLENYFSMIIAPAFSELSLYPSETDSFSKMLLREDLAEMACRLRLPSCVKQAIDLFQSGSYHPDVRKVVLCEGVRQGDEAVWRNSFEIAIGAESPERMDHLHALACTNNNVILERLLNGLASDQTFKRVGDVNVLLRSILDFHPYRTEDVLRVARIRDLKGAETKIQGDLDIQRLWLAEKLPIFQAGLDTLY